MKTKTKKKNVRKGFKLSKETWHYAPPIESSKARELKAIKPTIGDLLMAAKEAGCDIKFGLKANDDLPKMKRTIIYEGHLAGVQYSDYQRVAGIRAGREVRFWWERSNAHDPHAVKVTLDGVHIGYIPAKEVTLFHEQRQRNQKIFGEIVSYNRNNPTWQMIVVRAWINEEIPNDVAL